MPTRSSCSSHFAPHKVPDGNHRPQLLERAADSVGRGIRRLINSWNGLDANQRLAAVAAAFLLTTLVTPWFQSKEFRGSKAVSYSLTGFAAFTFVEASILLVCGATLVMLFARGERRAFHLPGGDGGVIAVGGAWCLILLIWRVLVSPPSHVGVDTGIEWGFMLAIAGAVALMGAGLRIKAAHIPEPRIRRTRRTQADRGGAATIAIPTEESAEAQLHFGGVEPPRRSSTPPAEPALGEPADDPTLEQLSIPLDDIPTQKPKGRRRSDR